jgi:hypothetical protein
MNTNPKQQQQRKPKAKKQKAARPPAPQRSSVPRPPRLNADQVGAVVASRLSKTGVSDIKRLRVSWVLGQTYVGDGTNGTADSVYLVSNSQQWLAIGNSGGGNGSSGWAPIASSGPDFGQVYVSDIERHFARKVIRKMWLHINSRNPSTANNMMAVIATSRGGSGAERGVPAAFASPTVAANTLDNLQSVRGSFTVNSWESRTVDITENIGGGSGAAQNEFDLQTGPGNADGIWITSLAPTTLELSGVIPTCIAVAGNSTTTGLRGAKIHQIVVEQEVDYVDFIGGMANNSPV